MRDYSENYISIIKSIADLGDFQYSKVRDILMKIPIDGGDTASKSRVYSEYLKLKKQGLIKLSIAQEERFLSLIRKKPVRTLSGVATVTVLTKPYPCPGKCIYCPNDVSMPKSYISSEPGAQRALANHFDPYRQVFNRLLALKNNGHSVEKIELIVLGGTFTFYPLGYQKWFILNCFRALNDFKKESDNYIKSELNENAFTFLEKTDNKQNYNQTVSKQIVAKKDRSESATRDESATWGELETTQKINETAYSRCIGLSLETRPDQINNNIVMNLRRLGATKIQIGVQTIDNKILKLNNRGHTITEIKNAFVILRQAGFKIQAHWMPNLYGSTVKRDISLFKEFVSDKNLIPDEIKIYPCSLIDNTELINKFKKKLWKPYTAKQLTEVLKNNIADTPRFIRLSRVVRDISSDDILAGNKRTNIRQDIQNLLIKENIKINEIRFREVREQDIGNKKAKLKITTYTTTTSEEYFLEFITDDDRIVGFMRLSMPTKPANNIFPMLKNCSIIREIHIYGLSLPIGMEGDNKSQHTGMGTFFIETAKKLSQEKGYKKMAVISSVGTREYYRKKGFTDGKLYQYMNL